MTLEQLGVLQRSQLEIWMTVTDGAVSGVNHLTGSNLQAIKAGLGETRHRLHEVAGMQDVSEWWDVQACYLQPVGGRVSGYTHNFAEIGVETQNGITRALQRHGDEVRHQWGSAVENSADVILPGVEVVANFFKASAGLEVVAIETAGEAGADRVLILSDVGALDITTR